MKQSNTRKFSSLKDSFILSKLLHKSKQIINLISFSLEEKIKNRKVKILTKIIVMKKDLRKNR